MLLTVLLNAGIRQGFFYFFPRKTYFKSLFSATSLQRIKTEYSFHLCSSWSFGCSKFTQPISCYVMLRFTDQKQSFPEENYVAFFDRITIN